MHQHQLRANRNLFLITMQLPCACDQQRVVVRRGKLLVERLWLIQQFT